MLPRILEAKLCALAKQYLVVTLTGPRQSGKTTLVQKCFPDLFYCSLEDLDCREMARQDPRTFLVQSDRMIIDEIQKVPSLVSYIQGIVDQSKRQGQFILTGSQQLELSQTVSQSLAGRTAIAKLLPLALRELPSPPPLDTLLYRGFYPAIAASSALNPSEALSFYTHTYLERDLRELKAIKNLSQFEIFLKLCASNIGQILNKNRLANDIGIDQKTVDAWLSLLQASYIAFLLPPHFKNFRKRLVKSPKLYFYDVGLVCYLLGIKKPEHVNAHPLKGALFENMVVMEKLKNAYNCGQMPGLYYFRDNSGNEVDLLEEDGPQMASFEIKLAQTLSSHLFRGLDFYKKLNPDNQHSTLIYTGEEESTRYGHRCLPYHHL